MDQKLIGLLISLILSFQSPTGPYGGIIGKPPGVVAVTWTVIQHPHIYTCNATTTGNHTCALTVTSTTAGNLLLLEMSLFTTATGTVSAPAYVSAASTGGTGDTFTECPAGARGSLEGT